MTMIVRIKKIGLNDPMIKYKDKLIGSLFKIDQYSGCFHEGILKERIRQGHKLTIVLFPIKLFTPDLHEVFKIATGYFFENVILELIE